ncbi:MAG: argininosuccinate lyase [Pyrinomonadaceae bacterium]
MTNEKKLWGGRFTSASDERFYEFNRSLAFDNALFAADIRGSIAQTTGLFRAEVLSNDESNRILEALNSLLIEVKEAGDDFFTGSNAEDIHSFIEAKLVEKVGELGKKIHTGRSRNDQVATAFRIWVREATNELISELHDLLQELFALAAKNKTAIMPGFTHLQKAQPIVFAHWCLAYFEMFRRDLERLQQALGRVNILPLGSGALAGTSFEVDREALASELGFEAVSRNSIDAVSDRDFCIEFASNNSLIMMHLSRFAEDVILYCTSEFGFFELSDKVSTGSSLMPQKKNPDSLELVRGKSGRVFGNLFSLLSVMKGLPLAYNKDMQEDKEVVFDSFKSTLDSLAIASIVVRNISLNLQNMQNDASCGFMNATELADYLVSKGIPFRDAHEIAGKAVLAAIEKDCELSALSLEEFQAISTLFDADVFDALKISNAIARKISVGGTAPIRVQEALNEAENYLASTG